MYCIVLDMVETGIFYNKDIFDKAGREAAPRLGGVPRDPAASSRRRATSRCSSAAGALSDWGIDLVFDQLYYDIILRARREEGPPERAAFLKHYLDWDEIVFLYRKGFFTRRDPRFREAAAPPARVAPVHEQEPGLHGHHPLLHHAGGGDDVGRQLVACRRFTKDPDVDFRWGVFYLPPITGATTPFAPEQPHPMCYIGEAGNPVQHHRHGDEGHGQQRHQPSGCKRASRSCSS